MSDETFLSPKTFHPDELNQHAGISLPGLPNMQDIQVTIFPLMERQDQFRGGRNKNGAKSAFYWGLITKSSV